MTVRTAGQSPRIAAVVPIYNRRVITCEFLRSFSSVRYDSYEIVIVNDGSTDGSADIIARDFPAVRLLHTPGDYWWSKSMNRGVRDALERGAEYILSINDDVSFEPDFLSCLVEHALAHPRTLVGSMVYRRDDRRKLWYAGGKMSLVLGELFHRSSVEDGELQWLTGMGTLIPAEVFREIGLYDDVRFPQYFGDADLSMRARYAGFALAVEPRSVLYNPVEESTEDILRRHVSPGNFLSPLFTLRSVGHWRSRRSLYARHWPVVLRPVAPVVYYIRFFAKRTLRLLKLR